MNDDPNITDPMMADPHAEVPISAFDAIVPVPAPEPAPVAPFSAEQVQWLHEFAEVSQKELRADMQAKGQIPAPPAD